MNVLVVVGIVLFVAGVVLLWRLVDWGHSLPGWTGEALMLGAGLCAVWEFGNLVGIGVLLLSSIPLVVALLPTPWPLRHANLLRSREVREAVANSRSLWESFAYRPSTLP